MLMTSLITFLYLILHYFAQLQLHFYNSEVMCFFEYLSVFVIATHSLYQLPENSNPIIYNSSDGDFW